MLGKIILVVLAIGIMTIPAYADILSPIKQMKMGVPLNMIQCSEDKILMKSPYGKPACLSITTSTKLLDRGYSLILTEKTSDHTIEENTDDSDVIKDVKSIKTLTDTTEEDTNLKPENQVTILTVSSPVDFVDDGREYKPSFRRTPPPEPMYDRIMLTSEIVIHRDEESGTASFSSPPHKKYSMHPGVGYYLEDWMPTHIPDGYRLLYANSGYDDYSIVNPSSTETLHSAGYYFVPKDFVLYENVTDGSLYRQSNGFSVVIKTSNIPYDELEDMDESFIESRESQSGNYGGLREMTRDGKYVSAYEGGNDLNPYTASIAFAPDEYTLVIVNSEYLTLDELIPVFNSIMN